MVTQSLESLDSLNTMSNKKGKSSKKAGKLTKAQRLKLLEEERRQREEEEARLQAEREEQERLERERKQEEIDRLELKQQECREDELLKLRYLQEETQVAVTKWKRETEEVAEWERYMRCDGVPDPKMQKEINTYISLWRDNPDVSITQVFKQSYIAVQLVEEVKALLEKVTDPQEVQRYQEAFVNLQEITQTKLDESTEEILKGASANVDTETGNMQTVIKGDNLTLCLWANLKMNPRFKCFNFEEVGFSFELPKQLAVSSIAVRILHTSYDHLSMLAKITHPVIHPPSKSVTVAIENLEGEGTTAHEETKENESVDKDGDVQQRQVEDGVQFIQGSEGQKGTPNPQASESPKIPTQVEILSAEIDQTGPQLIRPASDVKVIDLMQFTPLGGVFYCGMFHLPPQAIRVKVWEFRQVLDTGLEVFPYPTEKSDLEDNEHLTCPPVGVSVILLDCVVFLETPRVGCWDAAGKQWKTEGIMDVTFEEAESKISFKMESFQPFVLLQETYINFPFQSWELQSVGQDSALFTIKGTHVNLSISIQGNQCMLQTDQKRGLSHLLGKWMTASVLQKAMINAGINIFVNEHSDKYVSIHTKDPHTEHAAYEQMALFASACAFSWSKWNTKSGYRNLVLRACEHQAPTPVPEDSWSLYLIDAQRSKKLEITEESEAFSLDHCPGSDFHSTFIHMLQDDMSPDGLAGTTKSHYLFIDTVQYLLRATRPLVFSI